MLKKLILHNLKIITNTFLENRPKPFLVNSPPSYRPFGIVVNILKLSQNFINFCTWPSTAFQSSISEDAAIRIVLTLYRGSTLPHTDPTTYRVSHVPPYKVYAKFKFAGHSLSFAHASTESFPTSLSIDTQSSSPSGTLSVRTT